MDELLKEILFLCNNMDGLQREIEIMRDCLDYWDGQLEHSLENVLQGHGLLDIKLSRWDV